MGEQRMVPTRVGYADGLLEAGRRDRRVVVLDADVSRSIGSMRFAEEFPRRAFNVGISEQDMMSQAAGLALAGYVPFLSTYGVFVAGRAWDQMRTSVCYMGLNVKVGGAHAGVSVGPDGATHQALEDVAITRVLPGMSVLAPADAPQTKAAVLTALEADGPVYIRFGRNPVPVIYGDGAEAALGRGDLLRRGSDVTIVAAGVMVSQALMAAESLASKGIGADVINMVSIKPLDEELLLDRLGETGCGVVAQDHQAAGGLFGAVAELCSRRMPAVLEPVAVEDSFGTSGTPEEVRRRYGLTAEGVEEAARKALRRKG
jgi:transketolase